MGTRRAVPPNFPREGRFSFAWPKGETFPLPRRLKAPPNPVSPSPGSLDGKTSSPCGFFEERAYYPFCGDKKKEPSWKAHRESWIRFLIASRLEEDKSLGRGFNSPSLPALSIASWRSFWFILSILVHYKICFFDTYELYDFEFVSNSCAFTTCTAWLFVINWIKNKIFHFFTLLYYKFLFNWFQIPNIVCIIFNASVGGKEP